MQRRRGARGFEDKDLKIDHIECEYKKLRETLLPRLYGKVFHVTSPEGYKGIIENREIKNNNNKEVAFPFANSERSYGRKKGWICLYDLREVPEKDREIGFDRGRFFRLDYFKYNPYYLFINEKLYPQLIPWTQANEQYLKGDTIIVPFIECWYPADIQLEYITEVLIVDIENKQ